jgi:putative hydrolase of the HAD superfamily
MPNENSSIQAVLFDYGLVLSGPPDPAAWERMKQILHVNEEDFHAAYWRSRDAYDRGTLNGDAYWQTVAADLHRVIDRLQIDALIDADLDMWTQPNDDMIGWAARLQQRGIKTGILSNIGDAMETGVRARNPWLADFAHHTYSHRLGIAKPDLAIYRHAAEGLGLPPAAILFVDDREENIDAARVAGMTAVRYSGHASFVAAMNATGLLYLLAS